MPKGKGTFNQRIAAGCGVLLLLSLLLVIAMVVTLAGRARQATHYPGAELISSHSNYGGLPRQFHWNESYRTPASFTDVYHWYSVTFNLGAESRANGECILLEGESSRLGMRQYINVLLCNTPADRMIYVSRSTELPR